MKIHTLIQQKQNTLVNQARNSIHLFVILKWKNNKTIHVYTKQYLLMEKVLELQSSYSTYYNTPYQINTIVIKEYKNTNPHIKIAY